MDIPFASSKLAHMIKLLYLCAHQATASELMSYFSLSLGSKILIQKYTMHMILLLTHTHMGMRECASRVAEHA